MFNNIKEDLKRYHHSPIRALPIALSKLGFLALLNYRVGYFLRELVRGLPVISHLVWFITGISRVIINIISGIDISYTAKIAYGMKICHFSNIFISSKAVIGRNCTLHQGVTIGRGVIQGEESEPTIGDDVFIGANAVIIGAITLGDNVRIGANTCCFKSVSENTTVVSNGVRIIKNENSNIAQ